MLRPLVKGRYTARMATAMQDIDRAIALRHLCFITNRGLVTTSKADDSMDDRCQHVLVENTPTGSVVCCFRLMPFSSGATIATSHAAQFYDLTRLSAYRLTMLELGRFCIHPDHPDPDILRLAWAALARIVDDAAVGMLFGCTSFQGADPAPHHRALALLKDGHLAPDRWMPGIKAPHIFAFCSELRAIHPSPAQALISLPPLLRTYLLMRGWVSDHAVIDAALDTLHVFTGVEIAAIPPDRARLLRALAA